MSRTCAQVLRTIGSTYASQGQYGAAERNLRAVLEAQTELHGPQSAEAAETKPEPAVPSFRQYKFDEATRLLDETIAFYRPQRQVDL
jgi:hypothetical protein